MKIITVSLRKDKVLLNNSNTSIWTSPSHVSISANNAAGDRMHVQLSAREVEELWRHLPEHNRKAKGQE